MKRTLLTTIILGFATLSGPAVGENLVGPLNNDIPYLDVRTCTIPYTNSNGANTFVGAANKKAQDLGCTPDNDCSCLNRGRGVMLNCLSDAKSLCKGLHGEWNKNPNIH